MKIKVYYQYSKITKSIVSASKSAAKARYKDVNFLENLKIVELNKKLFALLIRIEVRFCF